MTTYRISTKAYTKAAFHAAKYPSRPVNGVFLGRSTSDGVEIEDSVPLSHHWTSLSPLMEIGLSLVSDHLRLTEGHWSEGCGYGEATTHANSLGLEVVGYYQAVDRAGDTSLVPVGEKLASTLKDQFPKAVAFVVCSAPSLVFCGANRWISKLDGTLLAAGEPALLVSR